MEEAPKIVAAEVPENITMFQGNRPELNRNNWYEIGLKEAEEEVRREQEEKKRKEEILAVPDRQAEGRTYDPYMPKVIFFFLQEGNRGRFCCPE